ncbi:MAG TPA: PH domain-containing protein [Patescibacteria group bacterium]|nr:PH domain-containing protein [Patescibacteria group bacterium]
MYSLQHLPNQKKGENGICILRRHWFTFLVTILLYVALIFVPFFAFLVIWNQMNDILIGPVSFPIFVIVISIYYLSLWTFLFHAFIDFYLDVWVVTNERIISIEQKGLFSRVISEQMLYRVQDVTSEIHGLFPTLLKYGNLEVQTAGQEQRFEFKNVPYPDKIVKLIHEESEASKRRHPEAKVEGI